MIPEDLRCRWCFGSGCVLGKDFKTGETVWQPCAWCSGCGVESLWAREHRIAGGGGPPREEVTS